MKLLRLRQESRADCMQSDGHASVACQAAALSWILGRKLTIAPQTETFADDEDAIRLRFRAHATGHDLSSSWTASRNGR